MTPQTNLQTQIFQWSPDIMCEVYLDEPDDFLKIKETLTRIGVSSTKHHNTLYQSCHILHKQGKYFIVHFKELFLLDGNANFFNVDDLMRRNTIALLLSDWGLLRLAQTPRPDQLSDLRHIKVIPFGKKKDWSLLPKYKIGEVKRKQV
jgi:hypothetical protein